MDCPSYIEAFRTQTLHQKAQIATKMLQACSICPRKCGVNRLKNEKGFCRTGKNAVVYSYFPHHGEEPPISGERGSGTIFFSRCTLRCLYCQNYTFSQLEEGREVSIEELADCMLTLQKNRCHNINLVTPTHIMPQILQAVILAVERGLNLPLVYNTSGYELPEIIDLLEGIIDIYLPDMRYSLDAHAIRYSSAPRYVDYNRRAVKEMHQQVGIARFDQEGIIKKGLVIRHLILPQDISGTEETLAFIAKEISPQTYISLMGQYYPAFEAKQNPPLNERITEVEYTVAVELLKKYGLENGWIQESSGLKRFAGIYIKSNI